jgi:sugar transferase (PEP-CTERM system associated)
MIAEKPMLNFLQKNIPGITLLQLTSDALCAAVAVLLALRFRGYGYVNYPLMSELAPACIFAVTTVCLNGAFGLYRRDRKLAFRQQVARMFFAAAVGAPPAYLVASLLSGRGLWDTLGVAILVAFVCLLFVRNIILPPLARTLLPHRVLILGTGADARVVEASLASLESPGVSIAGFFKLDKVAEVAVSPKRIVPRNESLQEAVAHLRVREIIVAVREQRGGVLPLQELLECRLNGIQVTDIARFFEDVHGRVSIASLKPSWLIYGNGFRQGWMRSFTKRAFDVVSAAVLLFLMLPLMLVVALLIVLETGFPVLYRQERVGQKGKSFTMIKFRSMSTGAERNGQAEWAVVNDARVTRIGRFLRQARLDELPQLINVLKGEMSLVGPRPERPAFVSMLSEQIPFYGVRHSVKPGITGWAQVRYSYGATIEQSMKKLEYDLYYVKNHTVFLDLLILLETVRVVLLGEGAR